MEGPTNSRDDAPDLHKKDFEKLTEVTSVEVGQVTEVNSFLRLYTTNLADPDKQDI